MPQADDEYSGGLSDTMIIRCRVCRGEREVQRVGLTQEKFDQPCRTCQEAKRREWACSLSYETLNGTWQHPDITVTFDFPAGRYLGQALGKPFDKQLRLIRENGQYITFTSDETTILATLQWDGTVKLAKEGRQAITFARSEAPK